MDKDLAHKLIKRYYIVKDAYVMLEEVDDELNSDLQPLNEFRAALDHQFRIMISEYDYPEIKCKPNIDEEAGKLMGHLNRAYFDICELLCSNFRLKIARCMKKYSDEDIKAVVPEYYTKIKPYINECEAKIIDIRLKRGIEFGDEQEKLYEDMKEMVETLYSYYIKLIGSKNEVGLRVDLAKNKRNRLIVNCTSLAFGLIGVVGTILTIYFGLKG